MEYDLKWESYHSWTSECIRNLSSDKRFADVTLLTEDLQAFQAHKIILSASSEFFKDVLETMNASLENYLFLKGVNGQILKPLLKFIYEGEVSVDQDNLSKFLEAGFDLKITGIMSGNESVMRKRPEIQTLEESPHPPTIEPEVEIKEEFTVKKSKRPKKTTRTKAAQKSYPVEVEINEEFTFKNSEEEESKAVTEPIEVEVDEEEMVSETKELDDEISKLESQMNISDDEESDKEEEEENESIIIKQEDVLQTLECEEESCGKKFTRKNMFNRHMKRVHSINTRVKDQPCPDCSKMFYTKHQVSVHFKRKHGNMEKTFPCPDCDKMFYQTGDVKQHVKSVHLKIKDLACGHCDMMFSAKSNLKSHMKKMHPSASD